MAKLASPRSPLMAQALYSPIENLPFTRFPSGRGSLLEKDIELQKEKETIQNQPYRTTPLITPGAKPRPDLVNNKLSGKVLKPTVYRPLEEKSVVSTLDDNRALVNRQFNSPKSLYSNQNVAEAVYVQTGVNLSAAQNKHFNPEESPTFQALMEDEYRRTGQKLTPAPSVQQALPPAPVNKCTPTSLPRKVQQLNSIGQPAHRIAQSGSFRRIQYMTMMNS